MNFVKSIKLKYTTLLPTVVFADNKGFLDSLYQQTTINSSLYITTLSLDAKIIFVSLMVLELIFLSGRSVLKIGGLQYLLTLFVMRFSMMMLWLAIIDHFEYFEQIMQQFAKLASELTQDEFKYSPSQIAQYGLDCFNVVMNHLPDDNIFNNSQNFLVGCLIFGFSFGCLLLFCLIALGLLLLKIETELLLICLVLLLGFMGSEWTKRWSMIFFKYLVGNGVKMLIFMVLFAIFHVKLFSLVDELTQHSNDISSLINSLIIVFLKLLILATIIVYLPHKIWRVFRT